MQSPVIEVAPGVLSTLQEGKVCFVQRSSHVRLEQGLCPSPAIDPSSW
jgi:hypothetical protein